MITVSLENYGNSKYMPDPKLVFEDLNRPNQIRRSEIVEIAYIRIVHSRPSKSYLMVEESEKLWNYLLEGLVGRFYMPAIIRSSWLIKKDDFKSYVSLIYAHYWE